MRKFVASAVVASAALTWSHAVNAADEDMRKEMMAMKKELEDLKKDRAASKPMAKSQVDKMVDNKYGPNAGVTTKEGKLTVGGLVQAWYTSTQNDKHGLYYSPGSNPGLSLIHI